MNNVEFKAPAVQEEPVAWLAGEVCGGDASHNTVNVALDNPAPWGALPIGAKVAIQSPQTAEQQPAPDVTGLVEALESAYHLIANHSGETLPTSYASDQMDMINTALATQRKQQEK